MEQYVAPDVNGSRCADTDIAGDRCRCCCARHAVAPRDTTWIPAGVLHCFRNTGDAPMAIFWTYVSIDATRTIVATGVTTRIDEEFEKPDDAVGNKGAFAQAHLDQ